METIIWLVLDLAVAVAKGIGTIKGYAMATAIFYLLYKIADRIYEQQEDEE